MNNNNTNNNSNTVSCMNDNGNNMWVHVYTCIINETETPEFSIYMPVY